jgi:hypothetical protein
MTATADLPTPRQQRSPVPYVLTAKAQAALAAWPANRIEHEPRSGKHPCDGRGCKCQARWGRQ